MHFKKGMLVLFLGIGLAIYLNSKVLTKENLIPHSNDLEAAASEELADYASQYHIISASCGYEYTDCASVSFTFQSNTPALHKIPEYDVFEDFDQGKTMVTFHNVSEEHPDFSNAEIYSNPIIEKIEHKHLANDFIVVITRNGPLTPAEVTQANSRAIIKLYDSNNQHPIIEALSPSPDSIAKTQTEVISVSSQFYAPYESAVMQLNGEDVNLKVSNEGPFQYVFDSDVKLANEREYAVHIVVKDIEGRSTAENWEFTIEQGKRSPNPGD